MFKPRQFRLLTRVSFFLLYLLTPVFDLFRVDLSSQKIIVLRYEWDFGVNSYFWWQTSTIDMLLNFVFLIFLPIALLIAVGAFISWKWGLLYCGWLCPHESVVEIVNNLMRRASGKFTFWDRQKAPEVQSDGTQIKPNKKWWLVTAIVIFLMAFVWAISILTYLQAPKEIYSNLINLRFTLIQSIFLVIATSLFIFEFTFARHLFCRFGCSLGLFQSLMWMLNKKSLVVGFDRSRVKECASCDKSCEIACPIQLKPRSIKRKMYSCSQCMRCIDACESVQKSLSSEENTVPLLQMINNNCALDKSMRDFGSKAVIPNNCYKK